MIDSRQAITAAVLVLALNSGAGADPEALAAKARCTMCHAPADQRMGPSWEAIAARYAGDAAALTTLSARARAGGSGEWGPAPMPPVTPGQLSDEELASVLSWVLDR